MGGPQPTINFSRQPFMRAGRSGNREKQRWTGVARTQGVRGAKRQEASLGPFQSSSSRPSRDTRKPPKVPFPSLRGVITSFEDKTIFHHEEDEGPRRRNVWIENVCIPSIFASFTAINHPRVYPRRGETDRPLAQVFGCGYALIRGASQLSSQSG